MTTSIVFMTPLPKITLSSKFISAASKVICLVLVLRVMLNDTGNVIFPKALVLLPQTQ